MIFALSIFHWAVTKYPTIWPHLLAGILLRRIYLPCHHQRQPKYCFCFCLWGGLVFSFIMEYIGFCIFSVFPSITFITLFNAHIVLPVILALAFFRRDPTVFNSFPVNSTDRCPRKVSHNPVGLSTTVFILCGEF